MNENFLQTFFLEEKEANSTAAVYMIFSVGVSVQNLSNLRFLYENHPEFSMFPTQAIIPGQMALMSSSLITSAIPGKQFDLSQVCLVICLVYAYAIWRQ